MEDISLSEVLVRSSTLLRKASQGGNISAFAEALRSSPVNSNASSLRVPPSPLAELNYSQMLKGSINPALSAYASELEESALFRAQSETNRYMEAKEIIPVLASSRSSSRKRQVGKPTLSVPSLFVASETSRIVAAPNTREEKASISLY